MTDPSALSSVIAQYHKHGWELKHCIARAASFEKLKAECGEAGHNVPIENGPVDGVWFARRSMPDRISWELRRLTEPPFALLTIMPDTFTDQQKVAALKEIEVRMAASESRDAAS